MFRENMFTTTTFTSIRFSFTICYRANGQPIMWQQFQPFWNFGSPNSIFSWSFRQNSLPHILFIKLKTACFKTNDYFENEKYQCLCTSQETQWGHFYQYQITTRAFHHDRIYKLQSEQFPVVLLIMSCMHITKLIIRNIREELIVLPF